MKVGKPVACRDWVMYVLRESRGGLIFVSVTIRRAEPTDAEAIQRIFMGPRVIWGTLQLPYPSLEARRKRLTEIPDGTYVLVACMKDEVVGHLTLWTNQPSPRRRHACALGMAVRDDWQGKGVGTALMQAAVDLAEKWLNLTRIELGVYVDNEPAIRLYKKFGFEVEGKKIACAFRDGQYVDTLIMARLRGRAQGGNREDRRATHPPRV